MTLEQRIVALTNSIGAVIKQVRIDIGNKAALNTNDKTNLVAAINEVLAAIGSGGGAVIDDNAAANSTTVAYSPNKITGLIATAKSEILGGAASAFDTLVELQSVLQNDANVVANLLTAVGNRVQYDAAQSLTEPQKLTACTNIGVGNYDRDFVADFNTALA
jgi:hypothetical protein